MKSLFTFIFVGLLGSVYSGFSQTWPESKVLEQYLLEGQSNSLALKQEGLEVDKMVEGLRQAKALFYPRLSFAPTYSLAAGGRRLAFPVGDMLNPAYKALNELTGTNQFPTNIQNVNELLAPNNFHDTKFSFQYAIYNPEIRYNYLIQKSLLSAGEARLKVAANEFRHDVEFAYLQHLQSREIVRIMENSRATLSELLRFNQKLVGNNVATKDVVFSAEYELSNLDRTKADALKAVDLSKAYFNFLLNRPLSADILIDSLFYDRSGTALVPLDELITFGLSQREELKQLGFQQEAARQSVVLNEKSALLPSFFVGGNAGFQGFGYVFTNQAYMVIQAGLQWDLFKGFERKSKVNQARIQSDLVKVKRTEVEKQIELQITQAYHELNAAGYGLLASASAARKAEEYFKIAESRYRNQNLLMVEYVKAYNDVLNARIQQSVSHFEVLIKTSQLNKIVAAR